VWVAVVTCDPGGGKAAVRIIHEAREASDRDDPNQWLSTTVAFRLSFMLALRGKPDADGKTPTRVLLGRAASANLDINSYPLVIDPDTPAVTVAPFRFSSLNYANEESSAGDMFAAEGAAAYQLERLIYPRLLRVSFPGTTREVAAEALPQHASFLMVRGGRAHVVQTLQGKEDPKKPRRGRYYGTITVQWYVVEQGEKRPKLVGVDLPLIYYVGVSAHYGMVAVVEPEKRDDPWTLQTVEILDAPPKK
jgi:hypothetical protein